MSDIPLAYDFYIDSMIEDMQNDPRPKHPEDIDKEVQQLKGIIERLLCVLLSTGIGHDNWDELMKIQHELKEG